MQVSVMKNKKLGIFLMLAGEAGESGEGKGARKKERPLVGTTKTP